PLSAKELVEETRRRGFKSQSANYPKQVAKEAYILRKRGILEKGPDAVGFGLGRGARPPVPPPASAAPGTRTNPTQQFPLRVLLTQILKKHGRLMTGSELASEALKAGYQTTSKRLVDAVWTALGTMDNVENVKGKGYRLRKPWM